MADQACGPTLRGISMGRASDRARRATLHGRSNSWSLSIVHGPGLPRQPTTMLPTAGLNGPWTGVGPRTGFPGRRPSGRCCHGLTVIVTCRRLWCACATAAAYILQAGLCRNLRRARNVAPELMPQLAGQSHHLGIFCKAASKPPAMCQSPKAGAAVAL